MRLSVAIPTYKRPVDLFRLVESLSEQVEEPDEVLIVVGPGDNESLAIAQSWAAKWSIVKVYSAEKASVIHAMNFAFSVAQGDVICLLDDDVWVPSDWARKIKSAYSADEIMGAYGGRDHLQLPQQPALSNPPLALLVGVYRWNRGLIGNHHCGIYHSPARVDVIKGCNLSFRRVAFPKMQIDTALEGAGAETCWEIDICQHIKLAGFDVVYSNDNYVLHYASPRMAFDNRSDLFAPAQARRMFNEALVNAKFRPTMEVVIFCLRGFLIGSRAQPGIIWSLLLIRKAATWNVLKLPWYYGGFMLRGIKQGFLRRKSIPEFQ